MVETCVGGVRIAPVDEEAASCPSALPCLPTAPWADCHFFGGHGHADQDSSVQYDEGSLLLKPTCSCRSLTPCFVLIQRAPDPGSRYPDSFAVPEDGPGPLALAAQSQPAGRTRGDCFRPCLCLLPTHLTRPFSPCGINIRKRQGHVTRGGGCSMSTLPREVASEGAVRLNRAERVVRTTATKQSREPGRLGSTGVRLRGSIRRPERLPSVPLRSPSAGRPTDAGRAELLDAPPLASRDLAHRRARRRAPTRGQRAHGWVGGLPLLETRTGNSPDLALRMLDAQDGMLHWVLTSPALRHRFHKAAVMILKGGEVRSVTDRVPTEAVRPSALNTIGHQRTLGEMIHMLTMELAVNWQVPWIPCSYPRGWLQGCPRRLQNFTSRKGEFFTTLSLHDYCWEILGLGSSMM